MIDCNNDSSCLLWCFQQCINLQLYATYLYNSHFKNRAIAICVSLASSWCNLLAISDQFYQSSESYSYMETLSR